MKKNLLKLLPLFVFGSTPVLITSCSSNDNNYVFILENTANQGDYNQFAKNVQDTFNELKTKDEKYKNLSNITITVKSGISDDQSKKDLLENGSADFAFLTSKSLVSSNFYNKVYPTIQTLTTSFTFDTDMSKVYLDGSDNDPLRVVANQMQKESFGTNYEYPFKNWQDDFQLDASNNIIQPHYGWNGIRYNAFYDTNQSLVNAYRGMIILCGTQDQIDKVKEAWNNKDWQTFRSYGLVVGDTSSAGTYLLQEQLLRTHFNLGSTWTIAKDRLENSKYYETDANGGTSKIGVDSSFLINFTDEGSFAWTHNTINNNDYSPTIQDAKIEIFTVTNPLLYDIGVFSNYINKDVADLLTQSIIYLYSSNNNLYGEGLGYNGYRQINDFTSEVLNPMKDALGEF